jgi:hypothetical protein
MSFSHESHDDPLPAGTRAFVCHSAFEHTPTAAAIVTLPPQMCTSQDRALNFVYEVTNSIDRPWYVKNSGVAKLCKSKRSTSMDDTIVLVPPTGEPTYYLVAAVGFVRADDIRFSSWVLDRKETEAHYVVDADAIRAGVPAMVPVPVQRRVEQERDGIGLSLER